jgi:hypothetical protein
MSVVDVVVSDEAREYVRAHGGRLFVRTHSHKCCHGSMTLLDVTTVVPSDADHYVPVVANGIDVRFRSPSGAQPHELVVEMRGVFRRHAVAYWDGCAVKP